MSQRAENSVLFALRDLRNIESERVAEEAAREAERLRKEELERARRRAAEDEARRAAEERARLAVEERARLASELAAAARRDEQVQAELVSLRGALESLRARRPDPSAGPALPVAQAEPEPELTLGRAQPPSRAWAPAFGLATLAAAVLGTLLATRPSLRAPSAAPAGPSLAAVSGSDHPSLDGTSLVAPSSGATVSAGSPRAASSLAGSVARSPSPAGARASGTSSLGTPASGGANREPRPSRHTNAHPGRTPGAPLTPSILDGCNEPLCGAKESDR
jgi:hypothetical protein